MNRGFTLVEALIVFAIIAIVFSIVFSSCNRGSIVDSFVDDEGHLYHVHSDGIKRHSVNCDHWRCDD